MTREEALKAFNRLRLAAMDRVRRDGRLSASARAVGGELFSRLDVATGDAYPSEEYLVEKLQLAPRTVKMAVKALQQHGYFTVVKRGRCNRYQPSFEAAEQVQNLHLSEVGKGAKLAPVEPDRGKKRPEQVQKTSGNRCKKGPATSLATPSLPLGGAAEGVGAPDGAAAPVYDLGLPGVALRHKLGDDLFRAWLGKVAVVGIDDERLTLSAPTKYVADRIAFKFEDAILDAWRVQHPTLLRLVLVVEGSAASAAATPISSRRPPSHVADGRWLLEEGVRIVGERMFIAGDAAQKRIVEWLKYCGDDVAGVRRILTAVDQQDLVGERFRVLVEKALKELLLHGQETLKFGPEAVVRRNAS